MSNKTRKYLVQFTWKEEGNRVEPMSHEVMATTVPRAISKLVADINGGNFFPEHYPASIEPDDVIRASDLLVTRCNW